MGEIRFRVWDNDLEIMSYSDTDIFITFSDDGICIGYEIDDEIDDYDLMQYIGLKDKNGREIYEGDIVEYKNEYHVIEWDDCKFMAKGFYCSSQDTPDDFFSEFAYTNCKVIGNIYENSELLERK